MLDKLKKLIGIGSEEGISEQDAQKQEVIDNMPLCLDDPNVLLEHATDESDIDAESPTSTRGFLMRPGLIKPKPQPKPAAQPTHKVADPNNKDLLLVDVVRYSFGTHDTLGKMYINGEFQCYTLEDEKRDVKVHGDTCIDAGMYNMTLRNEGGKTATYWQRYPDIHKGMIWLRDVPNFRFIYIHKGNHDAHTLGCVLVGEQVDPSLENRLDQRRKIFFSEKAYLKIYPMIANHIDSGKQAVIRITDQVAAPA